MCTSKDDAILARPIMATNTAIVRRQNLCFARRLRSCARVPVFANMLAIWFCKESRDRRRRHRVAEKVALCRATFVGTQIPALRLAFHAFGDDLKIQPVRQ